jgi:hypothetical protein
VRKWRRVWRYNNIHGKAFPKTDHVIFEARTRGYGKDTVRGTTEDALMGVLEHFALLHSLRHQQNRCIKDPRRCAYYFKALNIKLMEVEEDSVTREDSFIARHGDSLKEAIREIGISSDRDPRCWPGGPTFEIVRNEYAATDWKPAHR